MRNGSCGPTGDPAVAQFTGVPVQAGSAFQAADADHNGAITMMDVLLIARIAVS